MLHFARKCSRRLSHNGKRIRAKINERVRVRYAAERQTILARRWELGEVTRAARTLMATRKASMGRLGTRTLLGPWVMGPSTPGMRPRHPTRKKDRLCDFFCCCCCLSMQREDAAKKERQRERWWRWYQNNKERVRLQQRVWYLNNRDKVNRGK